MPSKLTAATFLQAVRQSGLIDEEALESIEADFPEANGDAQTWASRLVDRQLLTEWQASKLLQGKHRGFLLGNYRLLALLGKGGMSSVYLAEHRLMRRRCALKVLPTKYVNSASYLARFHREAQAVASLDHPNIVRAYDVSVQREQDAEIHFLVMEYVAGQSLHELVASCGPFSAEDTAEYIRQSAEGLEHAHRAGIIHRDVKPGNLLVDGTGTVKILDLGLARFFHEAVDDRLTLEHDEKVLGTADFLAPEQALDSHTADHRADVYSLGCTAYFLLTGHPPFGEGTLTQRLMAHQHKMPPPLQEMRPELPGSLAQVVERMMAKQPGERFQSAGEVADVMAQWLNDNASEAWKRRHRELDEVAAENGTFPPGLTPRKRRSGADAQPTVVVTNSDTDNTSFRTDFASINSEETETTTDEAALSNSSDVLPDFLRPARNSTESSPEDGGPAERFPELQSAPPDSSVVRTGPRPAEGASSTPAPLPRRRQRSSRTSRTLLGLGLVMAVLAATLVIFLPPNDDELPRQAPFQPNAVERDITPESPRIQAQNDAATRPLKWSIAVGARGDFSTVHDALAYLRETRSRYQAEATRRSRIRIQVPSGSIIKQPIVIDNSARPTYPDGIEIVCDDGPPVVLQSDGSHPAVELIGTSNVLLQGFQIRAEGAPVAIRLGGLLSGCRLADLQVEGFSEVGILGESVGGAIREEVILQGIDCRLEQDEAVGFAFRGGATGTNRIRIQRCRVLGSGEAGIQFAEDASFVDLLQNVLFGCGDGIRFEGDAVTVRRVTISNNTFYNVDHGILFADQPSSSSHELGFYRNLFSNIAQTELLIAEDYDESAFLRMLSTEGGGLRHNWSDRVLTNAQRNGEHDPVIPPHGRRISRFEFESMQPDDEAFLRPTPPERFAVKQPAKTPKEDHPYIGAVPPAGYIEPPS